MVLEYIKRGFRYVLHGVPEMHVAANISQILPGRTLEGKKVVITGGGRGLGKAMAKKFVSEGAKVLIAGRNKDVLAAAAAELGCEYAVLDIRKVGDFGQFLDTAAEKLGGLNVLVNNAGISLHEGSILNVSEEQFDNQLATNLKGSYFLAKAFIERIPGRSSEKASILFVSSERGFYVDDLPYGLTKVALNSLVQGLAVRFIDRGIRVNGIAPGVTASDMTGFKEDSNLYCSYNITQRVYLPSEVAEVASFIVSDASACLNGQILVCNEGKSINSHWR